MDIPVGSAASGTPVVAAVDVGGTSMKAAIVGADLRVRHTVRRPTPHGADAVVGVVADVLAELRALSDVPVAASAVVVPGIVDERAGIARFAANLGWRDADLRARLSTAAGHDVILGHDVRAGALAEWRIGAARGNQNVVFVPIGTGIAGALICDGRPVSADGYAGEIGHVVIDPDGADCGCGARGCLETVASARALARRYSALSGETVTTALEVRDRLRGGDPLAARVWDEGVAALATALAAVCSVVGPEVVVIGGGLSGAGEDLLDPLRAKLTERLSFHRTPLVVGAMLGDQAGCLGAALLALDSVGSES